MSRSELVSRALSLLVAAAYVAVCVWQDGAKDLPPFLVLLLPLALIWFPEQIGSMTGYFGVGHGSITAESPPLLVAFVGWVFLLGIGCLAWQ